MKITFKREARYTGLAAIGQGYRGFDIRLDGEDIGTISGYKERWNPTKFYFYLHYNGKTINTATKESFQIFDSEDDAKAAVKKFLKG